MITKRAKPTQQMRIAAQLGELAHFGESRVEVVKETSDYYLPIVAHGVGVESSGQDAEVSVKDLLQAEGTAANRKVELVRGLSQPR